MTCEALDSRSSGKGQRREPLFVNGDYEVVPVLVQREVARATASLATFPNHGAIAIVHVTAAKNPAFAPN